MPEISVKSFIGFSGHHDPFINREFRIISSMLRDFVSQESVVYFYPKNLFVDGTDIEAFVFYKDVFQVITSDRENGIIKTHKITSIKDFELTRSADDDKNLILSFYLEGGKKYTFNNSSDTNSSYQEPFREIIQNLHKHLVTGEITPISKGPLSDFFV